MRPHRSLLPLSLLLAVIAGCSHAPALQVRMPEPGVAATTGIEHREGTFEGVREVQLYEQSWLPVGEPRGVLVIVHGLKDHSGNYRVIGERLAGQGFAVHAFDLRGHGRSAGVRVWVDTFDDYLDDLDRFMKRVRERHPGRPIFLFGHSMGGAIATLYTLTHHPDIRGLVLSGAALEANVSAATAGGTKLINALSPSAGVFDLDLHNFSRDPSVISAALGDPLVYNKPAAARTARELLGALDRIQATMGELDVPLLAMHGGADVITPPSGSKSLVEHARSKDKTLKIYPGLFHDLLHEPEREQVMVDLSAWLAERAPAQTPAPRPAAAPPAAPPAPPAAPAAPASGTPRTP
jgi:alpha-beta hydrolase superfamily lysophospholipase